MAIFNKEWRDRDTSVSLKRVTFQGAPGPRLENLVITDIPEGAGIYVTHYGQDCIGINLCTPEGHTIRQIAYFDRDKRTWQLYAHHDKGHVV